MKKILAILMVAILVVCTFAACGDKKDDDQGGKADTAKIKVGVILLHDESVGYDLAHINGIKEAAKALNISDESIIWKKSIPEDGACADAAKDLAAQNCDIIISDSFGHQNYMKDVAEDYPEITFVSMTGDQAASSGLKNLKNAFTNIYESRYVSGVVAGMKLASLVADGTLTKEKVSNSFDKDGNIKVGYVGAFNYAEVVSGYTAFYLGIKSVVKNVVMDVEYTASWADEKREAAAASSLVAKGCVIIGQHADTTGAPAEVEKLSKEGKLCYSVGYNISMLDAAPSVALTSASNNWGVYYTYALGCIIDGKEIDTNSADGYAKDAVKITELGSACAAGTAEKVAEVEAAIKDGSLHVFDTSTWTVGGQTLTSYDKTYGFEGVEMIADGYFHESEHRAAPCFDIRIDGITESAVPSN